jgi:LDH2 family malate/lactate/ureidoglycolate dehydrogenase
MSHRAESAGSPVTRDVPIPLVRETMRRLLEGGGYAAGPAAELAESFLEPELRGHARQGFDHLVYYFMPLLAAGRVDPRAEPAVIREGPAYALIDARRSAGHFAVNQAVDLAVRKAGDAGCCTVGVNNSIEVYMVGLYAERAAREGAIGVFFTDSTAIVHPTGGAERVIGANVLAIAVPSRGPDPVVMDLSVLNGAGPSVVAEIARRGGILPEGIAVDAEGRATVDPARVLAGGAMSPFGGHRGYVLGLSIAFLSASLVGAAVGRGLYRHVPSTQFQTDGHRRPDWVERLHEDRYGPDGGKGHLFIAIDPAAFGDPGAFRDSVSAYIAEVKGSRRAPGVDEILVPGERSFAARRRALAAGTLPIDIEAWQAAERVAAKLGVEMPGA